MGKFKRLSREEMKKVLGGELAIPDCPAGCTKSSECGSNQLCVTSSRTDSQGVIHNVNACIAD